MSPRNRNQWTLISPIALALVAGCGLPDGTCSAYYYEPPPIDLSIVDEDGQAICAERDPRRGKWNFSVTNVDNTDLSPNEDRTEGYNEVLGIVYYEDDCLYQLVGWYDGGIDKALRVRFEIEGYESVTFKPKFLRDECGDAYAEPLEFELAED